MDNILSNRVVLNSVLWLTPSSTTTEAVCHSSSPFGLRPLRSRLTATTRAFTEGGEALGVARGACPAHVARSASEAALWRRLRGRRLGVQFRRQVVLGSFVVDFLAPSARLVVEVDGGWHAG